MPSSLKDNFITALKLTYRGTFKEDTHLLLLHINVYAM